MRLVQVTVPADDRESVEETLDSLGYDWFAVEEIRTEEYDEMALLSVPDAKVESVLDELYAAGLEEDDHVFLVDTEADLFGRIESQTTDDPSYDRIAAAELETKAEELLPDGNTYGAMVVLSTIVATTGLLLDSAAVVVGAMVIAPLFGPAVTTSVGTVIDKGDLFRHGIVYQVFGVALAVTSAVGFALVLRVTPLTPPGLAVATTGQIADRVSPDLLSLVVAFVAGIAGVLSLSTGVGTAVVGVMIAAALLPPAATVGIGVVWGEPVVAIHSGVLLLVNVLAINLAGLLTLWFLGYRPRSWVAVPQTRAHVLKRVGVLLVAILVVSAFLWQITLVNVQRTQTEDVVDEEVSVILENETYGNVTLVGVSVEQNESTLFQRTEEVEVVVAQPPGTQYPRLHDRINERLNDTLDADVDVTLRFQLVLTEGHTSSPTNVGDDREPSNDSAERTEARVGPPPAHRAPPGVARAGI